MFKGVLGRIDTVLIGVIIICVGALITTGQIWSWWGLAGGLLVLALLAVCVAGHLLASGPTKDEKRLLKWAVQNSEAFIITEASGMPRSLVIIGRHSLYGWHQNYGDEPPENARLRAHWVAVGESVQAKWGNLPNNGYIALTGQGAKIGHGLPDQGPIPDCEYNRLEREAEEQRQKGREEAERRDREAKLELGVRLSGEAKKMLLRIDIQADGRIDVHSSVRKYDHILGESGAQRKQALLLVAELEREHMLGPQPKFIKDIAFVPGPETRLVITTRGKQFVKAYRESLSSGGQLQ